MTDNQKFNKINAIIAIVIAFIAWVYVVYNYSPMKTVTYTNVPITYVGLDTLANKGLAIKTSTNDSVDVRLDVERKDFTNITVDDIVVTADVSQAVQGHNGISLEILPPENSALKKSNVRMISVDVEPCSTKDVDITTIYENSVSDGTEPVGQTMSYRRVSVVGCPSNVDKVCYAAVKIDSTSLEENGKSFVLDAVALDENGRKVPHILVLPSEISVNAFIGETKEVNLDLRVESIEHGMYYTAPKTIKIKGTAEALEKINSIEAEPVNLTGVKENTVISINYNLPEGVYISKASLGKGVQVTKEK